MMLDFLQYEELEAKPIHLLTRDVNQIQMVLLQDCLSNCEKSSLPLFQQLPFQPPSSICHAFLSMGTFESNDTKIKGLALHFHLQLCFL